MDKCNCVYCETLKLHKPKKINSVNIAIDSNGYSQSIESNVTVWSKMKPPGNLSSPLIAVTNDELNYTKLILNGSKN